ncbi:MAG TPA: LacI family DNA-binding transcriptional regulator [Aggregatilineales bacterium]|nr:LacI family DNA-binding transcriptional regulator [Aggregatilineales bacterium]
MPAKTHATITDVAQLASVSPKSVSRVLRGEGGVSKETEQRILDAIASLHYIANPVARRLRGASNVIGLILSGFEDYAGQIMHGISQAAQHSNYNLILYVQHTDGQSRQSYEKFLGSGLISGLLMIVPYDYDLLMDLCSAQGIPYVLFDYQGQAPDESVPTITVTNRKGVIEAMRYLLVLGHREIGFITGDMDMASARERLRGYQDALAEAGIAFDPSLVAESNWTQAGGLEKTRRLLERHPDLTAVVASDDLTAFGAMDAIKDSGRRVGDDISVIGFDDIPQAASVYPPLTTVRQPMIQMGETGVEMLIAMLEHRPPVSLRREFATELVIRGTTGRARSR